jgi:SAM-dependent methyltransferase
MTIQEVTRLLAQPALPALPALVRRELKKLLSKGGKNQKILDVGSRRSPYTIGLPCKLTLLDLPRSSDRQISLNLGLTPSMSEEIGHNRSNVESVILQDMTRCTLESEQFDGVICIEVIEHVNEDRDFVSQIHRVLKPGGWLLLTTPNGDYIRNEPPNYNPDHVRHYTRAQLNELLESYFELVDLRYAVKTGKHRVRGLKSLDMTKPFEMTSIIVNNLISNIESRTLSDKSPRMAHLLATAFKS